MIRALRSCAHRASRTSDSSLGPSRTAAGRTAWYDAASLRRFSAAPQMNNFLDEEEKITDEEKRKHKEQAIRDELRQKKGRLWSDPWDMENLLNSKIEAEEMPDWAADKVSRISQERVNLYPEKIPTLDALVELSLPPPPPPHPGEGSAKVYALQRKRAQYNYILDKVSTMADKRIAPIQALANWEEKQDAVDIMFEEIEFELKAQEHVLGKHPSFGTWVERALEEYLRKLQQTEETEASPTEKDEKSVPVFMDCFGPDDAEDKVVPSILHPLSKTAGGTRGRMVEEWELSANAKSRRVMLRQCTRRIAKALVSAKAPRIYVHGREGVGKTAALTAIVASARKSGYVTLYLPDGDRLHKNGFFVEPNAKNPAVFDLPLLSQEVCVQFLESHESDLASFVVEKKVLEEMFTSDQLEKMDEYSADTTPIVDLLKLGAKKQPLAATCYSIVVNALMNQEEKPFLIVMDEFNCYYQPGHYFHNTYDDAVKKAIPYNKLSLFAAALDAMALSTSSESDTAPSLMKKGGIIVASSESRAVKRKVTDALTAHAKAQAKKHDGDSAKPIYAIEVPRLSLLETEHMVSNYEATGVGKLRLDRGETVMNDQEVKFLRAVSGGVPQKLMDACIL